METSKPKDPFITHVTQTLALTTILAASLVLAIGDRHLMRDALLERNLRTVQEDFRQLTTASISYAIDRCGIYMPPDTSWRRIADASVPLTFETDPAYLDLSPEITTGRPNIMWHPLTTPVSYMAKLPTDPFRPGQPYGYFCFDGYPDHWDKMPVGGVFHSPGPNRKDDLDLAALLVEIKNDPYLQSYRAGSTPIGRRLIASKIAPFTYDPTNGAMSSGDIVLLLIFNNREFGTFHPVSDYRESALPGKGSEELLYASVNPSVNLPPRPAPAAASTGTVSVPKRFVDNMLLIGMDLADPAFARRGEALEAAGNRLGVYFSPFFADPPDIAIRPQQSLDWQASQWWEAMDLICDSSYDGPRVEIPRENLRAVLPLVGKSIVVLAVMESRSARDTREKGSYSAKKLERLEALLGAIYIDPPEPGSHDERILAELSRLCRQVGSQLGAPEYAVTY